MGTEFLRRTKPTIKKYVDRSRVDLCTADLFTRTPTSIARTALVDLVSNSLLCGGDQVVVEIDGGDVVITKDGCIAGRFANLPEQLSDAVKKSYGTALGEVIRINKLSKTAEVTIS